MIEEPVEARVYAKMHEDRETYIDTLRRARSYQEELADRIAKGDAYAVPFFVGVTVGAVGVAIAVFAFLLIVSLV